jgi:DNA polymerase-3 subunit gamma/tau
VPEDDMLDHYLVLSRKYRPKSLEDLIGEDVLAKSLRSCLDTRKVPHAFLFYGIRGVGKTTTARILSRCLNCLGSDGKTNVTSSPCGVCRSCIALDKDQHMDVMEVDAASRTGVDDIREIIEATQYAPILGRYKIFIIDEVHMLSKSAFNALLKTLEEPPGQAKFIFATTEVQKIPETIMSRCMTFQLKSVSFCAISEYLVEIAKREHLILDKDAADAIADESEGSVRDALSILEQAVMLSTESKNVTLDTVLSILGKARASDINSLLEYVLTAQTKKALAKADSMMQNGADPFVLYKSLQGALYKKIVDQVNGQCAECSLSNLLYLWQIFLKQTENMRETSYPEYVLNAAIVVLAHTSSFPNIEELMIKNPKTPESDDNFDKGGLNASTTQVNKSKQLIDDLLTKFPGASATDIE